MFATKFSDHNLQTHRRITLITIIVWTLVLGISAAWNVNKEQEISVEMARNEVRANFSKDQAFRRWATGHGGVYVKPDARTPPNPYLSHLEHRDVVTTTGVKLTLMNPAYMLRQMMQEYSTLYGVKGHITSREPLNPIGLPDPWERRALIAFTRGVNEIVEIDQINGEPRLRLIQPMFTVEGCLSCHAGEGYNVGEVAGGVSISVPMAPYIQVQQTRIIHLVSTHGGIWLLGLGAIGFFHRQSRHRFLEHIVSESKIHESEELHRAVFTHARDGILIINPDGNSILQFNTVAHEMLGYTHHEYTQMTIDDHVVEFCGECGRDAINPSSAAQSGNCEVKMRHKNGVITEVLVKSTPLTIHGETHFLSIWSDITERKNAERQLRDTQQEAENANRAKSEFLAAMRHDLRTPLNAIMGFSEVIASELFGGVGQKKYVDYAVDINDSGKHLISLINDILDLSKIEAGHYELSEESVDLAELTATCVRMNQLVAEHRHIKIEQKSPQIPVIVNADPRALTQIFNNLLSNAVKFSHPGRAITVSVTTLANDGVKVAIQDQGIGISRDEIDNVMEPFQQANSSIVRKIEGTGLGLHLSNRLVGFHGGTLSIDSKLDVGTTVTVHFPEARMMR